MKKNSSVGGCYTLTPLFARSHRTTVKRIIGILILLALTNAVYAEMAPEEAWNKTFGGTDRDTARSVQQTSDGGYILVGETWSYGAGSADAWLVKTDSNGNKVWDKTYGGFLQDDAYSVQQTSDGGYILTGYTHSYVTRSDDFWLVKTDSDGNKEWDKTYGGFSQDDAYFVQQTSDGGYILTGWTGSYGAGSMDAWLVKTDSNGNEQWNKTFGGTDWDIAQSVRQTSDDGYIIAGSTDSYGARVGWLIKTDSNGNKQWDRTFEGTGSPESVQQTSDGGYILVGCTDSLSDGCLVKTDPNGNKQWYRTFGEIVRSGHQTSNGGYILAGAIGSGIGSNDFWIVKIDSNGNKVWDKTFEGTDDDVANSVQQTSDGGYIIAGRTKSYGSGGYDAWLIKVGGETPTKIPMTGSISVSSAPSGADIYLDGRYKGTTPTTISDIPPGSHVLKLEKYGYKEWLTSVHVTSEVTESITAHLTPADISPPAIHIDKPAIIDQNNNGLLEEGEKVTIIYGANDPGGVASIKILLDETLLESQNRAGTYTITTDPLTMGRHTIKVEATDSKSNTGFEELPITVERTGPSVYFGTTRTTINKGEDAIFTLSAVNPIGNPPMIVQLILKPPSGVSVTSSSFAKAGSGIYTCTQAIESGDNVRSIEVHLTCNQAGTHEIESEVYYQFEGSPKSPTRYETLTLVVDDHDSMLPTPTPAPKPSPGFAAVVAITGLLAAYLRRKRA